MILVEQESLALEDFKTGLEPPSGVVGTVEEEERLASESATEPEEFIFD